MNHAHLSFCIICSCLMLRSRRIRMLFMIIAVLVSIISSIHCQNDNCRKTIMAIRERSDNNITVECYIFFGGPTPHFCRNDIPVPIDETNGGLYSFSITKELEGRYKCCCSPSQCAGADRLQSQMQHRSTCAEIVFLVEPVSDPNIPTALEGIWGEPLTIQCPFTPGTYLDGYKYEWQIDFGRDVIYSSSANSTINIPTFNPLFNGIYKCKLTTHGNIRGVIPDKSVEQSINVSVSTKAFSDTIRPINISLTPSEGYVKLQESETFYYDMNITGDEAVRFVVSSVNESVTILVDSNGIGCEAKQNYSIIECDNPQLMQGISTFLACSCAEPYKVSCALTVYAARKYTESLEIDCSVTNGVGDVITESALLHIIVPPPIATLTPQHFDVHASIELDPPLLFFCEVISFCNIVKIYWTTHDREYEYTAEEVLTGSDQLHEDGVYTSHKFFYDMLPGYEGSYCCRGEDGEGQISNRACGQLLVRVPHPEINLTITGDNVSSLGPSEFYDSLYTVFRNTTLTIACSVRSFAPPELLSLTIRNSTHEEAFCNFTYDGVSLYTVQKTYTVSSIDNVMTGCTIRARDSGYFSETAGVIINIRPVPSVAPTHDQTVTVGHNATFNCKANGFELFYNWVFHPSSFICSGDCRLEGEHESQLTISNVPYSESPVTVICFVVDHAAMTSHKLCTVLHIDGLVLIDQTEKNKTTMIKENEVSTIFCKFECPLDVLQPVTIKWIENYSFELEGQHYEHIDSDKRQTIGNLTLTSAVQKAAMLRSEQTPDLQSISLVYQCVGIIGNRTDEAVTIVNQTKLKFNVSNKFAAPTVTLTVYTNMPVVYGSRVALGCSTETLLNNVVFHWDSPANQTIEPVYSFDGVSKHTSLVTIDSVNVNAEGLYTCTATNAVGSGNDSVFLNMRIPPPTVSHIYNQQASVGENVTFVCLAEGVSLSYQWTIDPELNCVDCVQGRNEQILFLQNVPFHGIVHVTCIVTDMVQQKHSRSAVLTILASPPIVSITSPDITTTGSTGIQNGSSLALICLAISSVNVIFEWSDPYNHQLPPHLFLTSHNNSTAVYTSTLTIDPFTARAVGIYTCIARNEGGQGNDTINIDLQPTTAASSFASSKDIFGLTFSLLVLGTLCIFLIITPIIVFKCLQWQSKKLRFNTTSALLDLDSLELKPEHGSDFNNIELDGVFAGSSIHLLGKIGEGQFGIVYRGLLIDTKSDQLPTPVAVKTLTGSYSQTDAEDILEESDKMKQFKHSNVLSLICLAVNNRGTPCIVMPLMDRGSLLSYLKKERPLLSISGDIADERIKNEVTKKLLSMCLQVSKGMEYLVHQKFIHRDLAARNCMISSDGIIKVADFGLAEDIYAARYFRLDKNEANEPQLLPIKWTALEGIRDGLFTEKSDVWSFGVLCWEVFSLGRTPYGGMTHREVVSMLDCGERLKKPFNEACTEDIYLFMLHCWEEESHNRPTFSNIVVALEKLIEPLADYLDFQQF